MQIVDRLHRVNASQQQEKSAQATSLIKLAAVELDQKLGLAPVPERGAVDVTPFLKDATIVAALKATA